MRRGGECFGGCVPAIRVAETFRERPTKEAFRTMLARIQMKQSFWRKTAFGTSASQTSECKFRLKLIGSMDGSVATGGHLIPASTIQTLAVELTEDGNALEEPLLFATLD